MNQIKQLYRHQAGHSEIHPMLPAWEDDGMNNIDDDVYDVLSQDAHHTQWAVAIMGYLCLGALDKGGSVHISSTVDKLINISVTLPGGGMHLVSVKDNRSFGMAIKECADFLYAAKATELPF